MLDLEQNTIGSTVELDGLILDVYRHPTEYSYILRTSGEKEVDLATMSIVVVVNPTFCTDPDGIARHREGAPNPNGWISGTIRVFDTLAEARTHIGQHVTQASDDVDLIYDFVTYNPTTDDCFVCCGEPVTNARMALMYYQEVGTSIRPRVEIVRDDEYTNLKEVLRARGAVR